MDHVIFGFIHGTLSLTMSRELHKINFVKFNGDVELRLEIFHRLYRIRTEPNHTMAYELFHVCLFLLNKPFFSSFH